ncbi:MAG TPA: hypothetical protein VJP86_12585 [Vicinamibacterales bacterium]|jgi:hypothetical protein|nr:hypothetical protein [Vicinamibacterales bacterium]
MPQSLRSGFALGFALILVSCVTGCRSERMVTVGWDIPPALPDGYRVMLDDRMLMDIKPPLPDPSCSCLHVQVPVPRGRHTITVLAYTSGVTSPSATLTVD